MFWGCSRVKLSTHHKKSWNHKTSSYITQCNFLIEESKSPTYSFEAISMNVFQWQLLHKAIPSQFAFCEQCLEWVRTSDFSFVSLWKMRKVLETRNYKVFGCVRLFCFWIRELKQHFGAHWNLLFQAVSTWSLDISCQGGGSRTLNVTQNVLIRFWMTLAVSTHCKESFSRAWHVDQWGRLNAKINGVYYRCFRWC